MKLSEVLSQLTYGELSQVNLGGAEQGKIDEANYKQVVSHVNLGLTALYQRFLLKEGRLKLELNSGIQTYVLDSRYAASNSRSLEPVKYILDSKAVPFKNDVHKVERIYVESGHELGINQDGNPYACRTPTLQTIWVPGDITAQVADLPQELKTATLEVVYRANHPILVVSEFGLFDPARIEVELPWSHLQALLYYVASRVHNPIGMSNEFHAGNSWYAKYEAECQRLEMSHVRIEQGAENDRLRRNGWV